MAGVIPAPSLFVQPHFDDVALSCGGTAARTARDGQQPAIVTVFASEIVDAMVGDFAAWKHERWRLDDPDAVLRVRREEDARAAAVLGCRLRWLGLPDAIYRGDRYTSDRELYGPVREEEGELARFLADELASLPEWRDGNRVFVPLAVGSHVDHQLVFEAGACLARRGVEVLAYEDLPYAIHTPQGVAARLAQVGHRLGPERQLAIEASEPAKLAAVGCYETQLPVIFRFTGDWQAALRSHARQVSASRGAVERFWPIMR